MNTKDLVAPQPMPTNEDESEVWPLVIRELERDIRLEHDKGTKTLLAQIVEDAKARDAFGRAKYGVALVARNGRQPLIDAYQELLDGLVYIRAALELQPTSDPDARLGVLYSEMLALIIAARSLINEGRGG